MCEDCGCGDPDLIPVEIQESLLAGNDHTAAHNREHLSAHGVLALNLMGSPGSGKTAVLEATAGEMSQLRLAAVSGDLATDNDATRLSAAGIPCRSITTGSGCHLDARLVHEALHHIDLHELDLLLVENVGNLVCPAIYDLGQAACVVTLEYKVDKLDFDGFRRRYADYYRQVCCQHVNCSPMVKYTTGKSTHNVALVVLQVML